MRFKFAFFSILVLAACGPHPEIKTIPDQSPGAVWDTYLNRYQYLNSLALSGTLSIISDKTFECGLQLIYVSPDSFAFLAEGALGVDLVRGATIGESGFWEIPRENFHEKLYPGDKIYLPDGDAAIDLNKLLRAVFFFRDNNGFSYNGRSGSRLIYVRSIGGNDRIIEINRDSSTPVRQVFYDFSDTVTIQYYGWNPTSVQKIYPSRIEIYSSGSGMKVEYLIKKSKVNPSVKASFFLPRL